MLIEHYLNAYAQAFGETDRDVWNYEDGCVLIGLNALYKATGQAKYFESLRQFIDRYIDEKGNIRRYDAAASNLDFIPSGRVLFPLYEQTGEQKYRGAIEQLMEQLRHQPRTQAGSFWHKAIYPRQVWLDGLYMGLPFYAMYAANFDHSGRTKILEDILHQFMNARDSLFDSEKGLYYHAYCESRDIFWCDKKTGCSSNFWLRAIGWHLMAFADVYELLETDGQRKVLFSLWKEAIEGLLPYQDASGLFYQLPTLHTEPGNYLETSGSLMVAYSLMKGARLGVWPDERYGRIGQEILMAVEAKMFRLEKGVLHLGGMCKGAGLGPEGNFRRDGSVAYYLDEDVVEDEQKGVGVCMMAYAEYLLLCAKGLQCGPRVEVFAKPYDPIMPGELHLLNKTRLRRN